MSNTLTMSVSGGRGQYQHQIAAAYVINVRAVNHVLKGKTHVGSEQVAEARFNKSA
jgi:hypothetical protein